MGYPRWRCSVEVELPLALPADHRGAADRDRHDGRSGHDHALIGQGGYGFFINDGLQRFFNTPLILGALLSVALAVALDLALVGVRARPHAVDEAGR